MRVGSGSGEVLGVVLAGGRGRRIGRPKADLELGGRPLVEYPLGAFADAGIEAVVMTKPNTRLPPLEHQIWHEPEEPAHPLCGIVTALERADPRPVLVCGCDMPFVTPALLTALAARQEPLVVPRFAGGLHPLLALYDTILVAPLAAALSAQRPLQDTVAELEPAVMEEPDLRAFGDPGLLLFNVNQRGDLVEAERLLAGR